MTRVIADSYSSEDSSMVASFNSANSGCQVGGLNPEDRNVIASLPTTTGTGSIKVESSDCVIQGNYIGLAKDGVTDFATAIGDLSDVSNGSSGMQVDSDSIVGGIEAGAINVFSGNETYQLNLIGNNNVVRGNYFGTDYTGQPNSSIVNGIGVVVAGSDNNLIGGTEPGEGNIIVAVGGTGVAVADLDIVPYSFVSGAERNAVLGNTIYNVRVYAYEVFGDSNQGIDHFTEVITGFDPIELELTDQGPTPNDPGDSDTGPNDLINAPKLNWSQ